MVVPGPLELRLWTAPEHEPRPVVPLPHDGIVLASFADHRGGGNERDVRVVCVQLPLPMPRFARDAEHFATRTTKEDA